MRIGATEYNYQANHILISLAVTLVLVWVVSISAIIWFVAPTFYLVRECYQYFALERTKSFDWGGTVPVVISQVLAYFLAL